MNPYAYALVGLTAMIAVVIGVLTFAVLRFAAAARDSRAHLRESGGNTAMLSMALQDAVQNLRTQERAMTARAEASEQLSGQIVESLTAGLLVVHRNGSIQILNPAGRRLLGVGQGAMPETYRLLPAAAAPLVTAIDECLTTGQPIVRRALQMPEGNPATHLGVTVSPLGKADGMASGAICLFSDLTTVVALEEQLQLKEALARLGELTAGIAHEFRNGLATIHGYSRLLNPQDLPAQSRPYLDGIRQETEALGQVVTNFLNFARPSQVSLAPLDLASLIGRAADDLRHDMRDSGAEIRLEGQFGTIDGDDVLLRQAFLNLLRNAVEACVESKVTPLVIVEGCIDRQHHVSRVSVHDNGPGIPASARDKMFRPFFTTKSRGTGLGLAMVQKIVVVHNGRIVAGDSPHGGACVQVSLPLAAA
jgi:signal transduction histidine kinase